MVGLAAAAAKAQPKGLGAGLRLRRPTTTTTTTTAMRRRGGAAAARGPQRGPSSPLLPQRRRSERPSLARPRAVQEVIGPLGDAWSVSGNGLPPQFAGIETQLFQASLLPELLYLWFLSRPEADAPKLVNTGARMLLLFIFATIPAGIAAKVQFGDSLANVDVLHGTSESLLTFSNLVLALGFSRALSPGGRDKEGAAIDLASGVPPFKGMATFVAITMAVCGGGFLAAHAGLVDAQLMQAEPGNALSLPTWAVHVSSVAEWTLAMALAWRYADTSGNQAWKGLSLAMGLNLLNAYTPCTWHVFYNAPAIGALVPLQALLTLTGSSARAFAAFRLGQEGKRIQVGHTHTHTHTHTHIFLSSLSRGRLHALN